MRLLQFYFYRFLNRRGYYSLMASGSSRKSPGAVRIVSGYSEKFPFLLPLLFPACQACGGPESCRHGDKDQRAAGRVIPSDF